MGESSEQPRPQVSAFEVVDVDSRRREMQVILQHYLERLKAGEPFTGLMVIMEKPRGAYDVREFKVSGTDNVAERLGRLALLKEQVLTLAEDEEERIYNNPPRKKRA